MTLDEAIKHCLEVAEKNDGEAEVYGLLAKNHNNPYEKLTASRFHADCAECAADHRQLAEWLTELKELRNSIGAVKLKDMKEAVGLLQELNAENDQLTSQLAEAKRLLKLAIEDFKAVNSNMLTCRYCKHYDAGIDDCGLSDDDSVCEDICGWRYADEVKKLINDEK